MTHPAIDPKDPRYLPLKFKPGIFRARKATERIVIHALDTAPGWKFDIRQVNGWHVEERGWVAIGYHYVLARNGVIVPGRPVDVIGAHQPGWNSNSIAIALAGGLGAKPSATFGDLYTPDQDEMLRWFLNSALALWPGIEVVGHRDHPKCKKLCPGFDVRTWWGE